MRDTAFAPKTITMPAADPSYAEPVRTQPTLAIFMLSSFRVLVDGLPLTRPLGAKGEPLLKILAAHRRHTVPRDALMEMLWPGTDPVAGANSLKVAAHNLRSLLEPHKATGTPGSWILFHHGSYGLNPNADIWIDVESMDRHWQQGRRAEATGDVIRARAEYEAAEMLYTGDFLEEDIYEDWTIIRRERLRDTYLEIVSRLAELAGNAGDHHAVIQYCHKIVDADPCREDAYRTLMQSHASMNQLARAGAWYAVCRSLLQREMAAEPSAETRETFENLFSRRAG